MGNKGLPQGWVSTKLESITSIRSGIGFPQKYQGKTKGDIPFFKVKDISQNYLKNEKILSLAENYISHQDLKELKGQLFSKGTTVFAKIGEAIRLNRRAIFLNDGIVDNNVMGVKPICEIDDFFIFYFLSTQKFGELSRSTTVPSIRGGDIGGLNISLPPLAEQQEIVRVVESHLKLVDQIKSRLDALPKILEQFRQSVLASAVSGKLTEDWRASKQLNLINWGNGLLGNNAQVKGGKRLPKGEQLLQEATKYPYIRAGQLKKGTVLDEDLQFLSEDVYKKISQYIVQEGDVYITIVGACIGDVGIIPKKYDGANLTENAAKITNFGDELNNFFLNIILRSSYFQQIISDEKKSAAQGKLALKRIREFIVPLPSIEEQKEIVMQVENLFALADQIEAKIKNAQERVNLLTQSILAKAFRGELTAKWREENQDLISGENSAEALLKRIEAEKKKSKKK